MGAALGPFLDRSSRAIAGRHAVAVQVRLTVELDDDVLGQVDERQSTILVDSVDVCVDTDAGAVLDVVRPLGVLIGAPASPPLLGVSGQIRRLRDRPILVSAGRINQVRATFRAQAIQIATEIACALPEIVIQGHRESR